MTDFRALCAELADELQGYKVAHPMHCRALLDRARTALAQPEPVAPTDEELLASVRHFYGDQAAADMGAEDDLRTARAVLARWGLLTPYNTFSSINPPNGNLNLPNRPDRPHL
jgi:hypothetical protein